MKKLLKIVIQGTCEQCIGTLFIVNLSTIASQTKNKNKKEKTHETQNATINMKSKHIHMLYSLASKISQYFKSKGDVVKI